MKVEVPWQLDQVGYQLSRGKDVSIVALVDSLIAHAYMLRASDIHIEPAERLVRVRLRIDGVLTESHIIDKKIHSEIISRIKVLSQLRTDEHQAAQDGRFRLMFEEKMPIDVRVSITPTYYGENAVLRLLADKAEQYSLQSLGFSIEDEKKIVKAIRKPNGMILSTGPTGSGKTTTLYTILKLLNTKEVSLVTIEDPIEYAIEDITQIQINPRTGLTFANGLRSLLRQDPDIVMVGEIRDTETASIAVNTALTGHLLLSTLHTNDAATTLPRFLDMGVDPYLVASTVQLVIGQRLVRRLCEYCKEAAMLSEAESASLKESLPDEMLAKLNSFYRGKGCHQCGNTGYKGRIGINEVLVVDAEVRDAILHKAPASRIRNIAVENGMTTMFIDGAVKAAQGLTTVAELLRIISNE